MNEMFGSRAACALLLLVAPACGGAPPPQAPDVRRDDVTRVSFASTVSAERLRATSCKLSPVSVAGQPDLTSTIRVGDEPCEGSTSTTHELTVRVEPGVTRRVVVEADDAALSSTLFTTALKLSEMIGPSAPDVVTRSNELPPKSSPSSHALYLGGGGGAPHRGSGSRSKAAGIVLAGAWAGGGVLALGGVALFAGASGFSDSCSGPGLICMSDQGSARLFGALFIATGALVAVSGSIASLVLFLVPRRSSTLSTMLTPTAHGGSIDLRLAF